jgi:hypothetical protein
MQIEFSSEVRLGDLLVIGAGVVTITSIYFNLRNTLNVHNLRLEHVENNIKDMKQVMKSWARTDTRILLLEAKIKDLQRGEGWIVRQGEQDYRQEQQIKESFERVTHTEEMPDD